MYYRILTFALLLWLSSSLPKSPRFYSNYNASNVNDFAINSSPLDVSSIPNKLSDRSSASISEKYNLIHTQKKKPVLTHPGLRQKMLSTEYTMVYDQYPHDSVFRNPPTDVYYPLQILEFQVIVTNPSAILTLCINSIFSDCSGIKKALRRSLPICINPQTKYPINFNLYMTWTPQNYKDRLNAGIFFNMTINYQSNYVVNRVWVHQMQFKVKPNHLKLNAFQIRNCDQQNTAVTIKNYEKHDLIFLITHKYKKYYLNGQPLDDKFTVNSQKAFKFMLEAKDSTITINTKAVDPVDKIYPVLYIPVYCYEKLMIDNVAVGLISQNNYALAYSLIVSSHSNNHISIEEIGLTSSSGTVQLIRRQNCRNSLQPLQRYVTVAMFIVRSSQKTSFKNLITFKLKYSLSNSPSPSKLYQVQKSVGYTQSYNALIIGSNRYYDLTTLKEYDECDEQQKIFYYNYTVQNNMQVPIKPETIINDHSGLFQSIYQPYTGDYIVPNTLKEFINMKYTGPRTIPISPVKYLAAFQFGGDIFYPFQMVLFDRTLSCIYQNKQNRCSNLKYINFGYHKNDEKAQSQTIMFKNFNPVDIKVLFEFVNTDQKYNDVLISTQFNALFPPTNQEVLTQTQEGIEVLLLANHYINISFQVKVKGSVIFGEIPLFIRTPYQNITHIIKFNFEEGRLIMMPSNQYSLPNFDRISHSNISFLSTYQQKYQIKEIITETVALLFYYNDSQEYQHNQTAVISYKYNPYTSDNNITSQCCNEYFLHNHYLNSLMQYGQAEDDSHDVTLITNNDVETKFTVTIGNGYEHLIEEAFSNKTILVKKLKVARSIHFCLKLNNPYHFPLKYNVFFIPHQLLYKPKDFVNYFNHAKKQRVQAYFCYSSNRFGISGPNIIKQLLRLDEKPQNLEISMDSKKNIVCQGLNLGQNDYISSMLKTGTQVCYKLTTLIYFKLLIQSQIINYLLDHYHFDTVAMFLEKEWQFLKNFAISYTYDPFYADININFKKYCDTSVFPIFRFCLHYQITLNKTLLKPLFANKKENRLFGYILPSSQSEKLCINIGLKVNKLKFDLVIANNYSKYDSYNVNVQLIEPKVTIGDIAFQQNNGINHAVFIKHYFSSLAKANNQQLFAEGIINIKEIIPIYLTTQDFDDQFNLFKGQRFFQIQNHAELDIQFTHYGFEDQENIKEWFGLSIQKTKSQNQTNIKLYKKQKNTFLLKFNLQNNFQLNLTHPFYHRKINFYLYFHNEYHIKLVFLVKIADNLISKLKDIEPQKKKEFRYGYLIINLTSIAIISFVVLFFEKEEKEERNKSQKVKLKHQVKTIAEKHVQQDKQISIVRNNISFTPYLGSKVDLKDQRKYSPFYVISEDQLNFFKSLKSSKEEKSISQSSEGQFANRLSNEDYTEKTEEKSQSMEKSQAQNQLLDSSNNSELDQNEELDSQFSEEEHSIDQSVLPEGLSVCNQELDNIDQFFQGDFDSDFNKNIKRYQEKKEKKEDIVYYNVFSSENPLEKYNKDKKLGNPFPWIAKNIETPMKKRTRQKKKYQ